MIDVQIGARAASRRAASICASPGRVGPVGRPEKRSSEKHENRRQCRDLPLCGRPIGIATCLPVARDSMSAPTSRSNLHSRDHRGAAALSGVVMELNDCAFRRWAGHRDRRSPRGLQGLPRGTSGRRTATGPGWSARTCCLRMRRSFPPRARRSMPSRPRRTRAGGRNPANHERTDRDEECPGPVTGQLHRHGAARSQPCAVRSLRRRPARTCEVSGG